MQRLLPVGGGRPDPGRRRRRPKLRTLPGIGDVATLKHKKNGECIYLARGGCSIRERRPIMCRVFDCRGFYLGRTRAERQALAKGNPLCRTILNAGHQRLKTLDASEFAKVPTPSQGM
jgi:Fe-S-cluster containining protein